MSGVIQEMAQASAGCLIHVLSKLDPDEKVLIASIPFTSIIPLLDKEAATTGSKYYIRNTTETVEALGKFAKGFLQELAKQKEAENV